MEPEQVEALVTFLKAAGQPERLHILGLLVDSPASLTELSHRTGLPETAVLKHVGRLEKAALVRTTSPYTYQLETSALEQINHTVFHRGDSQNKETIAQRTLRHYTDGPRLKRLPDNQDELLAVLHWLANRFAAARLYPESEVNLLINQAHPDHAQIRRLLVDFGFLTRHRGIYKKKESAA